MFRQQIQIFLSTPPGYSYFCLASSRISDCAFQWGFIEPGLIFLILLLLLF